LELGLLEGSWLKPMVVENESTLQPAGDDSSTYGPVVAGVVFGLTGLIFVGFVVLQQSVRLKR
jgi:hypothetical protein